MISKLKSKAYIGVGGNIDPEIHISAALCALNAKTPIVAISTFYHTAAIGRPKQPDYLNGVVAIISSVAPRALKTEILRPIERAEGRMRTEDRLAARTVDLDILTYGDLLYADDSITIPDSDLFARPFLWTGLLELDPDFTLPGTGMKLSDRVDTNAREQLTPAIAFTKKLRARLLK